MSHIEEKIKYIYEQIGRCEMEKQELYNELNEVIHIKTTIESLRVNSFSFIPKYAKGFKAENIKNFGLSK